MATVFKPPTYSRLDKTSLFLAGSIEMGNAPDWQKYVEEVLTNVDVNIFNPRRDDWDSSWVQSIDDENFHQQVDWEYYYLTASDYIIFNFCSGTLSPITLMELGTKLERNPKGVYVSAATDFWRRGNVEVMCDIHDVPLFETVDKCIVQFCIDGGFTI